MHRFDPQQSQQGVGGLVEHHDQPTEHGQIDAGGTGQTPRQRFRGRDGQVLRIQLTEDHLHHRGHHQGHHRAYRDAHGRWNPGPTQQHAQSLADHRLGHIADQQSGDRDAQLGAGEHERGPPGDFQRPLGGNVTGLGLGLQADPVHRHVGELLGHEIPVGGNDQPDHHHAQQQQEHGFDHRRLPFRPGRPGSTPHAADPGE